MSRRGGKKKPRVDTLSWHSWGNAVGTQLFSGVSVGHGDGMKPRTVTGGCYLWDEIMISSKSQAREAERERREQEEREQKKREEEAKAEELARAVARVESSEQVLQLFLTGAGQATAGRS